MSQSATTTEVVDPHDTFFRQLLSDPVVAADLVQNYLPAEVVALLDLSQLRIEKETFVDARLRKHFSDVLYSVPLKHRGTVEPETPAMPRKKRNSKKVSTMQDKVYIYLLFEHKSQPDKGVRLQLLRYMVRIWEKEWKKKRLLSPIIPIVFYHGIEGWNYSQEFADMLEAPDVLKRYTPHFEHLLLDLSAYSDEQIRGEVWLQVCLLVIKHIYDPDLGRKLPKFMHFLQELSQKEYVMEMVQTLLTYVIETSSTVSEDELYQGVIAAVAPERRYEMDNTLAQKWIEKGIDIGKKEGIDIGVEKGKLIAQRQTILQLLHYRFPLSTEEESKKYATYLAQIDNLDILIQLVNHLLTASTLAEFEEKLRVYLPKNEVQK